MKKLDLMQMEDLQAATNGRNCMLIGFAVIGSLCLGPIAAIGWGVAVGMAGGSFVAGAANNCF